ncbi:hypothetical protein PTKIN_Ptkin13bG0304900 [Pterospermum kingtungense]
MESERKPIRRRSHTRKISQGCVINMAEARREITHALQLHRSKKPSYTYVGQERLDTCATSTLSCGCYSLVEAMPIPIPEPVWSTTAPSVPAAPPGLEAMEFLEWGENEAEASSYTWWLGFLGALDGNNVEKTKNHFVDNSIIVKQEISSKHGDGSSDQNASFDEWLMFPTTKDDSDEMVIP